MSQTKNLTPSDYVFLPIKQNTTGIHILIAKLSVSDHYPTQISLAVQKWRQVQKTQNLQIHLLLIFALPIGAL